MTQVSPENLTEEQRKQLEEKLKNMSPEELFEFQKQQCIFCQIIAGSVPSKKLYEDDSVIAILDINPAAKGHILLLPKEHYAIMPQVPDAALGPLFTVSKKLSQTLLKGLKVQGTNVFIANGLAAGQRAQHFMIHLIPRRDGDGILSVEEKLISQEDVQNVKLAIGNKLNELLGVKKEIVDARSDESEREEEEPQSEGEDEPETVDEDVEDDAETDKQEETDEDNGNDESEDENGGTNLDDIAGLF